MASSQKYILDDNDELKSSLITTDNKNNLTTGGLYKGLTLTDSANRDSANIVTRDLINLAGDVTLNWEDLNFNGDWTASGNLDVTSDITIGGDANVTGNITATNFSGNFQGDFSGNFDLSNIPSEDASDIVSSANLNTDDIDEGSQNFYYSEEKFKDSINNVIDVSTPLS